MINLWESKRAAIAFLTKDRTVSPPIVVPMDSIVGFGPSADLLHMWQGTRPGEAA